MRWQPLIVAALLAVPSALAQGNFLYTWHGWSGYFQASFQIPPEEQQPGQYFESGTFRSTFAVTSPDTSYPAIGGSFTGEDASGFGPPLKLTVTITDPVRGTAVDVSAYNGSCTIEQFRLSDYKQLWVERGYWTYAQIPEPSVPAILELVVIGFLWCATSGKT